MTSFLSLIMLAIVAAALYVLYRMFENRSSRPSHDHYVDGLDAMVRKDYREAAQCFRQAVEADSDHVLAYEKLGNVYRELGDIRRAAKIHRDLTVRAGLAPDQLARIQLSLCDDLLLLDRPEEARQAAEKAAQADRRNITVQLRLLELNESAGRLEEAMAALKRVETLGQQDLKETRARLKVGLALLQIQTNKGRAGRVLLKEALKDHPRCFKAMLLIGDSYQIEGRIEDALQAWERIPFEVPEEGWQVFERIEKVYFENGRFGDVESLYRRVIQKSPENPDAWVALAQFYERKGELEQAVTLCREGLEKTGRSIDVARMMIRLLGRKGDSRELIVFTSQLVERLMEGSRQERRKRAVPRPAGAEASSSDPESVEE
ncbi:MAG: tetratricopeptide repeat protein [Candidatus Cloacimonetes bacterium]|nr:tetratricopeptide repeat protein [Candidatus Cloacimonadota bacterium]